MSKLIFSIFFCETLVIHMSWPFIEFDAIYGASTPKTPNKANPSSTPKAPRKKSWEERGSETVERASELAKLSESILSQIDKLRVEVSTNSGYMVRYPSTHFMVEEDMDDLHTHIFQECGLADENVQEDFLKRVYLSISDGRLHIDSLFYFDTDPPPSWADARAIMNAITSWCDNKRVCVELVDAASLKLYGTDMENEKLANADEPAMGVSIRAIKLGQFIARNARIPGLSALSYYGKFGFVYTDPVDETFGQMLSNEDDVIPDKFKKLVKGVRAKAKTLQGKLTDYQSEPRPHANMFRNMINKEKMSELLTSYRRTQHLTNEVVEQGASTKISVALLNVKVHFFHPRILEARILENGKMAYDDALQRVIHIISEEADSMPPHILSKVNKLRDAIKLHGPETKKDKIIYEIDKHMYVKKKRRWISDTLFDIIRDLSIDDDIDEDIKNQAMNLSRIHERYYEHLSHLLAEFQMYATMPLFELNELKEEYAQSLSRRLIF